MKTKLDRTKNILKGLESGPRKSALRAALGRGPDPCNMRIANDETGATDEINYVLYLTIEEMATLVAEGGDV